MKVALLNDSFPPIIDGVANVVLNYAKVMTDEELAEVMVCTPEYPDTDYSVYPYRVVPYQSFDTTRIAMGYRTGNPFDIRELHDMAAFEADIIHTHCPVASTYIARMLRAKTGAPVVFTYHTKFDEDIARTVKGELLQKETGRVLARNIEACDEVWVVSEGAGQNLCSLGYQGDYRVMNNGVDFSKGRVDDEQVAAVTAGYDLPEGVPVFLFVGRIIEYKGIPVILDAMSILNEAGLDYRMVIIGGGADYDKYTSYAAKKGLMGTGVSGKVIFTGPIRDRDVLRAWNTRADLFLFPSTFDTNGIVVREAAACGLASVLIKGSCAAEGVTDDRNGFLIEKNASDLADLLRRVSKDLEHVHDVGQHAMDELYISWADSVHAAYERYGQLIDMKNSGELKLKIPVFAEHFAEMSDEIITSVSSVIKRPRQRFEDMIDNMIDNMHKE